MMANAVEDLAISVNLTQFASGLFLSFRWNHKVIDEHTNTRTDAECIFLQLEGLHKKSVISHKDLVSICTLHQKNKLAPYFH